MHSKELNIKQVAINGKAGTVKIDERCELLTVEKSDGTGF
jgi:hypothetical protein